MFKKKESEFPTISKHDHLNYDESLKSLKQVTETYTTTSSMGNLFTPKRLAIFAIAAAVGVGYYFYSKNKNKKGTPPNKEGSTKKSEVATQKGGITKIIIAGIMGLVIVGILVFYFKKKKG